MRSELRSWCCIFALGLPLAVAVAGLGGYALARRALAPVERMTERARSITAERLSDRLPVDNPDDEMGRLATVFNETLGRLRAIVRADAAVHGRRLARAAHAADRDPQRRRSGPARATATKRRIAAIIGSMLEEADRLASLVDRLLTLSRAETGRRSCRPTDFDLRELAEKSSRTSACWPRRRAVDRRRQARAPHGAGGSAGAAAGADQPRRQRDQVQPVRADASAIRVAERPATPSLDVVDSGAGIDAAARERIFDRFYRGTHGDAAAPGWACRLRRARWRPTAAV